MKRIQTLTAEANKFGAGKNGFTNGDPTVGLLPTELEARWFDQSQEAIVRTIEAAGETPSDDPDQFTRCLNKLIESRVGDYALDTGALNAPVVAMNPAVTAYINGMEVSFRLKFANTGPVTLNAGDGAKALVRDDGAAMAAGDLPVNVLINAFYDLPSDKFIVNSLVTSQALSKIAADALYVSQTNVQWLGTPVGSYIGVSDEIAGVVIPPTNDPSFRYIKCTASDAYNTGVLTSESVTGSAPLVIATAVVSLVGSSFNGLTVNLINTERRVLRAGSSGVVEQDALQGHRHQHYTGGSGGAGGGDYLANGSGSTSGSGILSPVTDTVNGTPRTANETRGKGIGITYYRRIK